MCVIIDASVAGRAFKFPRAHDFVPLWEWIEKRDGRLVFGGRLTEELYEIANVKRLLKQLWQAGRASLVDSEKISREDQKLRDCGKCKSNDTHIVAIARVSGARVLCTDDHDLQVDFKNRELVSAPRGKIYRNANHKALLRHNGICVGRPR